MKLAGNFSWVPGLVFLSPRTKRESTRAIQHGANYLACRFSCNPVIYVGVTTPSDSQHGYSFSPWLTKCGLAKNCQRYHHSIPGSKGIDPTVSLHARLESLPSAPVAKSGRERRRKARRAPWVYPGRSLFPSHWICLKNTGVWQCLKKELKSVPVSKERSRIFKGVPSASS